MCVDYQVTVPRGSDYPGSAEDLAAYQRLVERHGQTEVKGAKNPYTSRNGWMTSFLDPTGLVCLRLSSDVRDQLLDEGGAAVEQYGRDMPDFASLPAGLDEDAVDSWFARSWDHAGTLEPK